MNDFTIKCENAETYTDGINLSSICKFDKSLCTSKDSCPYNEGIKKCQST